MSVFVKSAVTTLVFLAVYLFSSLVVFAQLVPDRMFWLGDLASLLSAAAAAFWVWHKLGDAGSGILTTTISWAAVAGALAFCGGFFGPLIFTPEANQGPLLGIFITGPLGFFAGGIGGLIYAVWRSHQGGSLTTEVVRDIGNQIEVKFRPSQTTEH